MLIEHTANGVSLDLISAARSGDRQAFGDLVRGCRRRVLSIISRMIARPEDVEDVGQEVFLRMHLSIPRLQVPEAFDLWVFRLTTNTAYDYLRRRPCRPELRMSDLLEQEVDAANDSASLQHLRDEHERRRTVEYVDSLLDRLCPSDRLLLVMREVEGLSMEELAVVLGIQAGAVKLRLFRARHRLRRALNPETDGWQALPAGADLAAEM
jgi:RNA polymerase sigma-70 factor (ECF subfamily)